MSNFSFIKRCLKRLREKKPSEVSVIESPQVDYRKRIGPEDLAEIVEQKRQRKEMEVFLRNF